MNNTAINSDTVVAYEPPSLNANQGGNVLFGDGHVEFLTHAQMLPMLARLAAGESPVRVPLPP
jgi:prepilin-type processing-associated H-X9-DG protein